MKQYQLSEVLINGDMPIKTAMKRLNEATTKILFAVDNDDKFLGTLTDGDIRRGLLSDKSLDSLVKNVCNQEPFSIGEDFNRERTIAEMQSRDIVFAPVIDEHGRIKNIFALPESHKTIVKKPQIKQELPVVIMAGGKGTRMAPFTNVLPKPLVPVGDRTILEVIINEFLAFGLKEYYFTLNFKGEIIKAYFDTLEKPYNVNYVWEKDFWGTAGSLSNLRGTLQSAFIVSNCDIIIQADISEVYEYHKKKGAMLTMISSIQHHTVPYGVVEFAPGGEVIGIEEKPEYTFPINTGVYILEPECLDCIPENEVFHMTHLIDALMKDKQTVCTFPINENEYIDIGQWNEYRKALDQMGL